MELSKKSRRKRMPRNLGKLEIFMKEEWDRIPDRTLKNLVGSMKKRCKQVIQKNGDHINLK